MAAQEPGKLEAVESGNSAATFGMPPGFLDSSFSGQEGPAQASTTVTAVDPVMAQMLRQQMLLTQGVMDLLYRTWTSATTSAADTNSSAELSRVV